MIVAVVGPSGSGKTTLARWLAEEFFGAARAAFLSADNFYQPGLSDDALDAPAAFDFPLLAEKLRELQRGAPVKIPRYDFVSRAREEEALEIPPREILVVEGLFLLASPEIRELADKKIFVELPPEKQLARRLLRDAERLDGADESLAEQIDRFLEGTLPGWQKFGEPQQELADLVVSNAGDLSAAQEELRRFFSAS